MNRHILTLLAGPSLMVLASAATVQIAAAQDTATAGVVEDTGAAEIVVTARRVEERLQDVPISMTVFNQQQLNDRNVVNAQDLAGYTPSLAANSNFGTDNATFAIRGFVQDIGTAPSVGVYFADVVAPRGSSNGIPSGDGASPGSFFDLANVQVLKGPQGTLQGRNTTGGAVILVPQKPTHKLEGYVEGSIGNFDMQRLQAVINVPFGDTFRMRLGVDRMTRDGFLTNVSKDASGNRIGPDAFGDTNYYAVRASFVADLTPDLENYTIVSFNRSKTYGAIQKLIAAKVTPIGGGVYVTIPGIDSLAAGQLINSANNGEGFYTVTNDLENPYSKNKQWQVINTTTWKASDSLTVKNIASYAELRTWMRTAQFGTNFVTPNSVGGYPFNFATVMGAPGLPIAAQSTFTEELQFQGRVGDDKLIWQAGAYFESSNPLGLSGTQNASMIDCADSATLDCENSFFAGLHGPLGIGGIGLSTSKSETRSIGLYGQATYALTEQLKLTGGLRYTWDRTKVDSTIVNYYLLPLSEATICTRPSDDPLTCNLRATEKSSKPTWTVDLDYKPTEDVLVYAKYSRGYRAGGIKADAPEEFIFFKPERVDAYELGLKSSFRGAVRGTFNLTGFYNKFSNQQLMLGFRPEYAVPPASAPFNAGKSRMYGAEVEASVTPFKGLNLVGSYAYLNTKIQSIADLSSLGPDFSGGYYSLAAWPVAGSPLFLSPKHKFSVTGTYTLPLDESIGRIAVGATYSYSTKQTTAYTDRGLCHASSFSGSAGTQLGYPMYIATDASCSDLGILGARGLLNLNLNWNSVAGLPLDLALFATNVTKKKYYNFIGGTLGSGFEAATVGEPRMYGLRLKVHFGE